MIADALGWQLDRITDEVKPKIAETHRVERVLAVDPGYVSGIIQDGVGYRHGTPSSRCTWRRISARPSRTTQSTSKACRL